MKRKKQDDTVLVSTPSWSITLLSAKAKMSHSRAFCTNTIVSGRVWKWELVGMHKGNRHSVWDFRPFIIYKMLVAGSINYFTSKESGGLVLLFLLRISSLLCSIIYVFPRKQTCQLISLFYLKAEIITNWWSNSWGESWLLGSSRKKTFTAAATATLAIRRSWGSCCSHGNSHHGARSWLGSDQWPFSEQDKERRRKNVLQLFDSPW